MAKIKVDVDWEELSDDELMEQRDLYWDIIHDNLDEQTQPMLGDLIEIERTLTLREEQPY